MFCRKISVRNHFLLQVLVKGRGKARAHAIPKSSGLKTLARGVARRSQRTIARQAMGNMKVRQHVLDILARDVQKEMTSLCSKRAQSMLRASSFEAASSFTWDKLTSEISAKAPTLYAILEGCVNVKRKEKRALTAPHGRKFKNRHSSKSAVMGMCAAILLRNRNHHMNLVQRIVALILHSGHSAKQVRNVTQSLDIHCDSPYTM